jgi:hypothetical protein
MPRWSRAVLQLLLLLFLIYAGTCLLVALFQGRLVWFPGPPPASTPASQGLAFEAVTLHTEDDVALDAWFLPAERPIATVLVCHAPCSCATATPGASPTGSGSRAPTSR